MNAAEQATFVPRFLDGSPHVPQRGDAYVHVRLAEPARTDGAFTVYLADGTALVVCERDLLQLAPAHDTSEVTT
jgi:hypothetical protein